MLQACHPYDQHVAKQDKLQQRQLLDKLRITMKGVIDKYSLVLTTNRALNKIRGHVWRSSFDTMNLRPSTRVSFDLLKETQIFKTALKAGNYFFSKHTSLYESIPAAWKHMTEQKYFKFALLVDYFYAKSRANPSIPA